MTTEASRPGFLTGIVLAAGASRRMGRPKALLPLGDRCLLQHVVDAALASRLDEVVVVLGCDAAEIAAALALPAAGRARVVLNSDYPQGQSTSLTAGLAAADESATAAAILLGDHPTLTAAAIDRVADAFERSERPAARPVYPDAGDAPGHPVLLDRSLWSSLTRLSGDQGARFLLARHPEWLLAVPVAGAPPPDVDTREDYERVAGID